MRIKNQKLKIKNYNPPLPPFFKGGVGGLLTPSNGFTLLELVVAIAIFAIISTFVYGAYTGTVSTTESAQKKIDLYQKARLVLSRISEELEQTASPYEKGTVPDFSYFSGSNDEINGVNADEIGFVSRADSGYSKETGKPGLARIVYRLEVASGEGNEYYVLIRKEDPIFFREDEEREKSEVFIEKCEGINFEYNSDGSWVNEWDDQTTQGAEGQIPRAVRITLTLKDDEGKARDFSTIAYLPQGG